MLTVPTGITSLVSQTGKFGSPHAKLKFPQTLSDAKNSLRSEQQFRQFTNDYLPSFPIY